MAKAGSTTKQGSQKPQRKLRGAAAKDLATKEEVKGGIAEVRDHRTSSATPGRTPVGP